MTNKLQLRIDDELVDLNVEVGKRKTFTGPDGKLQWELIETGTALTDKNYRKAIVEYSGASSLELHQMLAGFNPSNVSFMGKVADKITFASGFQGVNKLNKFISAYTGYEAALKWQRIAKNSKIKARVEWAKSNLKNMGVDDINKKVDEE